MTHPQVALGEIATLIRGITYKPSDVCEATTPSAVACMRTKNVQEELDESDIVWIPASLIRNSSKYLNPGDILVSSANSWNLVGKGCWVPELKYPASAGGFISILRGNPDTVDLRYLYHWFVSPQTQAKLRSYSNKTTNISNLDHARTLATEIPLPPLEEQRRIAAILDKVQSLKDLFDARRGTLGSFEGSLFCNLFGDRIEQSINWKRMQFADPCSRLTVGVVARPASYYCEAGVPALRSLNIKSGNIQRESFVYVSSSDNDTALAKSKLSSGDLVFVRTGGPGTCAVIPPDLDGCNAIDLLLATVDTTLILPEFACSFFNSSTGKAGVLSESRGQIQQHFNAGPLAESMVPVPPLDLQQHYCEILGAHRNRMKRCDLSVDELGRLAHSIASGLLSGV